MRLIKRQAKNKLESLTKGERNRIVEKINKLGLNPDDPLLDVKPLQGELFFRLRVGSWRVIFERKNVVRIIIIEKIKSRGDVYK